MSVTEIFRSEQTRIFDSVLVGNANKKTLGADIDKWFLNHTQVRGFFEGKEPEDLSKFHYALVDAKVSNPKIEDTVNKLISVVVDVAAQIINQRYLNKDHSDKKPEGVRTAALKEPTLRRKKTTSRTTIAARTETKPNKPSVIRPPSSKEKTEDTSLDRPQEIKANIAWAKNVIAKRGYKPPADAILRMENLAKKLPTDEFRKWVDYNYHA